MRISESVLRRIIREELEVYRPTVGEVVENTVRDFFEDMSVDDLSVVDKGRVRDESGHDFLERHVAIEFYDEVEVFRVIFDIASEEGISARDISLEDLGHVDFGNKRAEYVYNLRLDALRGLSEEELSDLESSLNYLSTRENNLSLLTKRISSNLGREGYTFNYKSEIIDIVLMFLKTLKSCIG